MKRLRFTFLSLLLFCSCIVSAQENDTTSLSGEDPVYDETIYEDESAALDYRSHDPFRLLDTVRGQLGIFALTTPFFNQQAFGGGLDLQAWYTDNLAVGFSASVAGRQVDPTFGYNIGQARLMHLDISLFNEFKLAQWYGFEASARLYTGFSAFHLDDKSVKVPYTWYDEYGNEYEGEKALPVAKNYFMRIAPAAVLRYHISRVVMIEGSLQYNWFIGDASFGRARDFNNYQAQLGFKFEL